MAKTGKFRCSACGRVFAMAAHLGRHTSTVHAPKGKRVAKATSRHSPTMVPQAASDIFGLLLHQLQASHAELAVQRVTIDSQVTALDQAIAVLGGPVVTARTTKPRIRRRARRRQAAQPGTLRAHIEQVLLAHHGPLAIQDIATAVRKAGFKSRDKNLSHSVGKCLRAMPGVVKAGRGVFGMK